MLFLVNNNDILLIIISEHFQKIFGRSESLKLEISYYTYPASEFEHSMSELYHFFLILISVTCRIQVILQYNLYQWRDNYISFQMISF